MRGFASMYADVEWKPITSKFNYKARCERMKTSFQRGFDSIQVQLILFDLQMHAVIEEAKAFLLVELKSE